MARKDPGIQYGPNVKPSPNSQGTLFRGVKPVDAHRYQRGYTPERKEAVEKGVRFVGPPQLNAQSRDAIARSTVPLHNLIRPNVLTAGLPSIANQHPKDTARAGEYKRGTETIKIAAPSRMQTPTTMEARARTLIHEYGHFISDKKNRPHALYRNDTEQGQEEAFADNVSEVHYRPDPRSLRREGTYLAPQRRMYGMNRSTAFKDAYTSVRKPESRGNTNNSPTHWDQGALPL